MANTDPESGKRSAAKKAVSYVRDGMLIGLGTGSTTQYFLKFLSDEVKNGLDISGIPTSKATEKMARKLGIKISKLTNQQIDIDFDGADEVDTKGNLIKGGGGALTREKIVAASSRKFYVMVDESKISESYLSRKKLPVEILPFLYEQTVSRIRVLCDDCEKREGFITDNGNYIVDCSFYRIDEPARLESQIKLIPGVVEVGLFVNMATKIIVGNGNSAYEINPYKS